MKKQHNHLSRRDFTRSCLLGAAGAALAGTFAGAAENAPAPAAAEKKPAQAMQQGKIGPVQASRLIMGCNLFGGGHHHTMLWTNRLSREYNTEAKIRETFEAAEDHGINTFMTHNDPQILGVLKKHLAGGGKMQWFGAPICGENRRLWTLEENPGDYAGEVREMADQGASGIYVFGVHSDEYVKRGKAALIERALESIRITGLPAGVACHSLDVVKASEKLAAGPDFYIKTLHHHNYLTAPREGEPGSPTSNTDIGSSDNCWCKNPDETIAFMKTVEKPWVAFKVMAAGMIQPGDGFRYAYENGADFVLAGIFDFQIEEDVKLARGILDEVKTRPRPWRG